MSKLALIRHGESLWNARGLWTGWHDIGLSKKGKNEALLAGRLIAGIEFHHGFTSDLKRAWQTLDLVKKSINNLKLPTSRHPEFKERHYGIFAGRNKWQIRDEIGEEQFLALRRGWNIPVPEGETLQDVYYRVLSGYRKHLEPMIGQNKNLLFAAHGNSIRALMKHLEKISDREISRVEIDTGEVVLYTLSRAGKIIRKERRRP